MTKTVRITRALGLRRLAIFARPIFTLSVAAVLAAALAPARAAPLIADLSEHLVQITAGFTGTDVLLFGATDGPGDVIVIVRGPAVPMAVRRKHRVAGIWINRGQIVFEDAPSFYMVAASKPIEDLLGEEARKVHQIGRRAIKLTPDHPVDGITLAAYRSALRRNRDDRMLFQFESGTVRFLGQQLFRADISFPATVPTGTFTVQVFLVRDGAVVTAQTTPLFVSKAGFDALVFDFAHDNPALYGLVAIALALFAGWLAGMVFGRR